MVVFIIIALIVSAITGGIYYYQSNDITPQTHITTNATTCSGYLSKTLVDATDILKTLPKNFKDVFIEEKLRRVSENNIVQLLNIKFIIKDNKTHQNSVFSFIIKNTMTLLPVSVLKDRVQQTLQNKKIKEYINSNKISFTIATSNSTNGGSLIMPTTIMNLSKYKQKLAGHSVQSSRLKRDNNPFETIEFFTNAPDKNFSIYSTFTLIDSYNNTKSRTSSFNFYTQLYEFKESIIRLQLEKIENLPDNIKGL